MWLKLYIELQLELSMPRKYNTIKEKPGKDIFYYYRLFRFSFRSRYLLCDRFSYFIEYSSDAFYPAKYISDAFYPAKYISDAFYPAKYISSR